MDRKSISLLVFGCILVVAVAWRQSEADRPVAAPRPLQLTAPASAPGAPAARVETPAQAPKEVPSVNAGKKSAPAPAPAPKLRMVRPEPPQSLRASATTNTAVPAAAPAVAAAPSTYERRVNDAAALGADDADRAVRTLQQLAADQPDRPEAYEALATIRLRQGDLRQATAMIDSAMRNGGKATFTIMHDHTRGNFEESADATCTGELSLLQNEVVFEGADGHRFSASWSDVRETGSNKFFGSGIGGFHLTLTSDGKYKNFNLAPKSRDKAETKLILDLLNANARRGRMAAANTQR